ncbi:TPA: mobilization protein [Escherichia coli]|nr:mobilization protein [Escherichia coli]
MLGGADNPNGELPSYITGADKSAGAEISRAGGPLESVIYHEQQIRDEQERQARLVRERARSWHEEQEREARVWRGPSIGM